MLGYQENKPKCWASRAQWIDVIRITEYFCFLRGLPTNKERYFVSQQDRVANLAAEEEGVGGSSEAWFFLMFSVAYVHL